MTQITNIEETAKYRKKKKSNTSKSKEKSNHKHEYKECLIRYPFNFAGSTRKMNALSGYCHICGKIGCKLDDSPYLEIAKNCHGDELYEQLKDKMPVFEVDDFFIKKVDI